MFFRAPDAFGAALQDGRAPGLPTNLSNFNLHAYTPPSSADIPTTQTSNRHDPLPTNHTALYISLPSLHSH